jgi:hypothetical protein
LEETIAQRLLGRGPLVLFTGQGGSITLALSPAHDHVYHRFWLLARDVPERDDGLIKSRIRTWSKGGLDKRLYFGWESTKVG